MVVYFGMFLYWLFIANTNIVNKNIEDINDKKKKFYTFVIVVLPLFLIMALRATSVGCDLFRYKDRYNNSANFMSAIYERGFSYLNYFFQNVLNIKWQMYISILALFFILSLYLLFTINNTQNVVFSFFIHATIGLMAMSMSGIRQILAISICLFAVVVLFKVKKTFFKVLLFIGLVIAAYFIHNSAIAFLIVLPLYYVKLSKRGTIIAYIIAIFAIAFRNELLNYVFSIIPEKYTKLAIIETYSMNPLDLAVTLVVPLFCIIFSHPKEGGKYDQFISLMFIFACLNVALVGMGLSNNQFGRMSFYFLPSYCVLIPYACGFLKSREKLSVVLSICVLCTLYFFIGNYQGTLQIDNYKFFWTEWR